MISYTIIKANNLNKLNNDAKVYFSQSNAQCYRHRFKGLEVGEEVKVCLIFLN